MQPSKLLNCYFPLPRQLQELNIWQICKVSLEIPGLWVAPKSRSRKLVALVQVLHIALEAVIASSLHVESSQVKTLNLLFCSSTRASGVFEEVIEDLRTKE